MTQDLSELRRHGVRLRSVGGAIRWRPKDATGVRAWLRAHKPAVLASLASELPRRDAVAALRTANYPPAILALRFELHGDDHSLPGQKDVLPYVTRHESRVHGLAVASSTAPGTRPATQFEQDVPALLDKLRAQHGEHFEKATVVMHNARLHSYVLNRGWSIRPRYLLCTESLRNGLGGTNEEDTLAGLARRYGLDQQAVLDPDGAGLEQRSVGWSERHCQDSASQTIALAWELLRRIRWPEVELPLITHTARLFSARAFAFDTERAGALLEVARQEDERLLAQAGLVGRHTAVSVLRRLTAAMAGTGRALPTKPGKDGPVPALASNDPESAALASDPDPQVAALMRAFLHLGSSQQTKARLRTMIDLAEMHGAGLPVDLAYCGARTGRFKGQGGLNWQNLPSRGEALGTRVRGLLHARPGHVLVIADAAQVESRIVAWLAGETRLLESYRAERDAYAEFASDLFGERVRRPGDMDSPEAARRLHAMRGVGKEAVLALGFGMGAAKLWRRLQSNKTVQPLIESGELSAAKARGIVRRFRRAYPRIPRLWRRMEDELRACLRHGKSRGRFHWEEQDVLSMLPSGRAIRYETPRLIRGSRARQDIAAGRKGKERLYGALLVENQVQGIARDLLALAILDLEAQGYPVALHVHDELVLEVPFKEAAHAKACVLAALTKDPQWLGRALPLAAEAYTTTRYAKESS